MPYLSDELLHGDVLGRRPVGGEPEHLVPQPGQDLEVLVPEAGGRLLREEAVLVLGQGRRPQEGREEEDHELEHGSHFKNIELLRRQTGYEMFVCEKR